ncbi:MAG: hypothetical protein PHO92_00825 [Candidatus Peribacteraceae bacterium]|nr:hypothetical protein [Candidatus Peribacteraceae bacterium]
MSPALPDRPMSNNSKRKGDAMEAIFEKLISLLKPELNEVLASKPEGYLKELNDFKIVDAQRGGAQAGKDKALILSFLTSRGIVKVPVLVEIKAHDHETSPRELDLHTKIDAIKNHECNQQLINSNEFIGASFMLFIPLGKRAPNTEYEDALALETKPDHLEFPDHSWEIDNEFLGRPIFEIFEDLCTELNEMKDDADAYLFAGKLQAIGDKKECQKMLRRAAELFMNDIQLAIDKHQRNHLRNADVIRNIDLDNPTQDILSEVENRKISNPLSKQVEVLDTTKQTRTNEEIVNAEGKRTEYLSRALLIQYNGGYFGESIPEIEKHYSRQIQKSGIWEDKFDSFREIEKEVKQSLNIDSFEIFDQGKIIKPYLLSNDYAIAGCFYENMANGLCKYEVNEKISVKNDKL